MDSTPIKSTEQRLRILQRGVDATTSGILITDALFPDNPIIYSNPAFERLTGYRRSEIVGSNCRFLQGPKTDRRTLDTIREAIENEIDYHGVILNYRKDGSAFWNELVISPVRNNDGILTHFIGIQTDATARKLAEEEIEWVNRYLRTLYELAAVVSHSVTMDQLLDSLTSVLRQFAASGAFFLFPERGVGTMQSRQWGDIPPNGVNCIDHPIVQNALSTYGTALFPPDDAWNGTDSRTLVIPVCFGGERTGVICLYGDDPLTFRADRRERFDLVGSQVASAIHAGRAFQQVKASEQELQSLSHYLVEVQEAERARIARELHDEIGQVLTGLNIAYSQGNPTDESSGDARLLIQFLMSRVREISHDLHPSLLDDFGLSTALYAVIERFTKDTQIVVHYREHISLKTTRFDAAVELTAYRLIQECLTNAARYAKTSDVAVSLQVHGRRLVVEVSDRGQGFDLDEVRLRRSSIGLRGMRERVQLIGGTLTIDTSPGHGTRVRAEIPLAKSRRRA